jgi:hypothetical protein
MWRTRAIPKPERLPYREVLGSRGVPLGINVAIAAVPTVVAVVIGGAIPSTHAVWRMVPVCVVLVSAVAGTVDALAGAIAGVLAFFLVDGFLVNRLGELSWHGMSDVDRVSALAMCVGCGWAIGVARRALRKRRFWRLLDGIRSPTVELRKQGRSRGHSHMEVERG